MPSAYVQITCDTTLHRLHDGLLKQRTLVSNSSKTAENACKYLRLQVKETMASNSIIITRAAQTFTAESDVSLTPACAIAPTVSAAARLRKKAGGRRILSADEVSAMFNDDSRTEAKYYFIILHAGPALNSILPNLEAYFTDLFEVWGDRPNSLTSTCSLEVCIVGRDGGYGGGARGATEASGVVVEKSAVSRVSGALLAVSQRARDKAAFALYEHEMRYGVGGAAPPPPSSNIAIDSFVVTSFDTEREVGDRVLHIGLYFSQCKDAKVRSEVVQHAKRKVDDADVNRLYATCLCEIPNVSERRAHVITSTFPTMAKLLKVLKRDDGTFENAMARATEFGESRKAGHGLAANIRAALSAVYVPDAEDPHIARIRREIHEALGITAAQQYPYLKQLLGGGVGDQIGVGEDGTRAEAGPSTTNLAPSHTAGFVNTNYTGNATGATTSTNTSELVNTTPPQVGAEMGRQDIATGNTATTQQLILSGLGSSAKKKPRPSAVISLSSSSSSNDSDDEGANVDGTTSGIEDTRGTARKKARTELRPPTIVRSLMLDDTCMGTERGGDGDAEKSIVDGLGVDEDYVRGSEPLFAAFQLSQQLREEDTRRPRVRAAAPVSRRRGGEDTATWNPLEDDDFSNFGLDSLLGLSNSNSLSSVKPYT